MTDELFTTPETLSPRLRWMRDNRVEVWLDLTAHIRPWTAKARGLHAYGETEDEALVGIATKLHIRLWNEQ